MREMKDSGVDWIANIPTDWTINKMKYLFSNGKGLSITKENLIETGLPVISYGQIHSKVNRGTDIKDTLLRYVDFQYQANYPQCEVFQYDFVFADTSEDYDGCGNCVYKRDTSLLFGGYHAIIMHSLIKHDNRFFAYLFKTDAWRKQLREVASGVKVFSITQKALMNCSIIIPPEDEQKEISDFLDAKCAEFNALISDLQSQIETLEEYKKSLVFRVVSKGIKKTALKATTSDVWTIIPKNWRLIDIKYIFEIVKRIAGQEGFDVLSVTQKGLKIKDIESNNGQQAESYAGYQFVYPTDYVMNHMDLLTGWVDCSTMFGVTSPDYRVFRLRDKENNNLTYFKYLMQCCYMSRIFYSLGQGVSNLGRWRLQTSAFNNFMIPVPPLEEQCEIAGYLDTKISEIDTIIADKQKQIETIEEYKKSLIFEYVTGKKEVQI